MKNDEIYFISINTIPKEATNEDIIKFASYVNKHNQTMISNFLNNKRIKEYQVEMLQATQPQIDIQPEIDFKSLCNHVRDNPSEYLDY